MIRKTKKHGILSLVKTVAKNLKLMAIRTENFVQLDVQLNIDLVAPLRKRGVFFVCKNWRCKY